MGCTIVQLTDLHVRPPGVPAYRVAETNMLTERALRAVAALRPAPDAVIVTGDLTDCGLASEYALLRGMLARCLRCPVYLIPGNHDRREVLLRELPGTPSHDGFVQYAVDTLPIRLVMLDTVVPGAGHDGVEHHQSDGQGIHRILHEAVVTRRARQLPQQHLAAVVVAGDQVDRAPQTAGQHPPQQRVLGREPAIREVARDDHGIRRRAQGRDGPQRPFGQHVGLGHAIGRYARGPHVQVRQLDDRAAHHGTFSAVSAA